jgi:hypothetical protein
MMAADAPEAVEVVEELLWCAVAVNGRPRMGANILSSSQIRNRKLGYVFATI